MENNNPMLRLIVYGKLKQMMMSYEGQKLRSIDKNLLRGLYVRKIKDFKEDMHEKFGNKSLYARLKSEFLKAKSKHDGHHVKVDTKDNSGSVIAKDAKKERVRRQTKIKALNSSVSMENSIRELKISQVLAKKKDKQPDASDDS